MRENLTKHFVNLPHRGLASDALARVEIVFSGAKMPLRGGAMGL
jgi:hypothetical protein